MLMVRRFRFRNLTALLAAASLSFVLAACMGCQKQAQQQPEASQPSVNAPEEAAGETTETAEVAVEEVDAAPEAREVMIQYCSS